jgi:hypothetical protein
MSFRAETRNPENGPMAVFSYSFDRRETAVRMPLSSAETGE